MELGTNIWESKKTASAVTGAAWRDSWCHQTDNIKLGIK